MELIIWILIAPILILVAGVVILIVCSGWYLVYEGIMAAIQWLRKKRRR